MLALVRVMLTGLLFTCSLTAQHPLYEATDARNGALGGAALADDGFTALWSNAAGLATHRGLSYGAWVQQASGHHRLKTVSLGAGYGGLGVRGSVLRIGTYAASRISTAYGRRLTKRWRLGGELSLFRQRVTGYAGQSTLGACLATQYTLTDALQMGLHWRFPGRADQSPMLAACGGRYRINQRLMLYVAEQFDVRRGWNTLVALAYRPVDVVGLRLGYSSIHSRLSFGASYRIGSRLAVDVVAVTHPLLGLGGGAGFARESDNF